MGFSTIILLIARMGVDSGSRSHIQLTCFNSRGVFPAVL